MNESQDSEKQYLAWYYDHLVSVSKVQARLAWIILILLIFSILLLEQSRQNLTIPFINLDFSVKTLQIVLPIILSFIFWEYLGSMRAASISVKNIQFRMKNLEYKADEFNLYDVDTYLNFFDIITFNFRKHINPGTKIELKKYDWRHLPYLFYALIFICVKIYILINYDVTQFLKCFFGSLIVIDIIFAFPLISNRIKRFFTG